MPKAWDWTGWPEIGDYVQMYDGTYVEYVGGQPSATHSVWRTMKILMGDLKVQVPQHIIVRLQSK